jgi:hypothetical protein
MKRDRFISALREECAGRGWRLVVDSKLGKGSHYRLEVWDGDRLVAKSTLKSGDLSPLYEKLVRKQLGLGA